MGLSLKSWLIGKLFQGGASGVTVNNLWQLSEEFRLRELAFNVCINMIANAVGKCEFETYKEWKSIREKEYYTWNIEPNANQNSTEFIHKLIFKLCSENEVLVIEVKNRRGQEMLVVADNFIRPQYHPAKMNEYKGVTVGELTYDKTFYENEILHFSLNHTNIKPVIDSMYQSYYKLVSASMKNYTWSSGKHLKVHVGQITQGDKDFAAKFGSVINEQVKPWLNADGGVLPEFDGYQYENIGGSADVQRSTRDIKALMDDIFAFTANAFGIPPVLLLGSVEGTKDAMTRWLTTCIDPICDQLQEEIIRKRYKFDEWKKGNYLRINTSAIFHFDMFANAANIEKLIGSGAYSINDVLAAAGQARISEEWADKHWLTLNIGTMNATARAAEDNAKGGT